MEKLIKDIRKLFSQYETGLTVELDLQLESLIQKYMDENILAIKTFPMQQVQSIKLRSETMKLDIKCTRSKKQLIDKVFSQFIRTRNADKEGNIAT